MHRWRLGGAGGRGCGLRSQRSRRAAHASVRCCEPRLDTRGAPAQVIASKEAGRLPVKVLDHTAFMFVKHGNMYAVAVSSGNAQAALAFQFLHELIKVLKSYFGDFTEESVRNNFILIYELLDEARGPRPSRP